VYRLVLRFVPNIPQQFLFLSRSSYARNHVRDNDRLTTLLWIATRGRILSLRKREDTCRWIDMISDVALSIRHPQVEPENRRVLFTDLQFISLFLFFLSAPTWLDLARERQPLSTAHNLEGASRRSF